MEPSAWAPIIAQLPLLAAAAIALGKGWVVVGRAHDAQMADKDRQIAFVDGLRIAALARVEKLSDASLAVAATLKEAGETVDRALALAEGIIERDTAGRRGRAPRGAPDGG